MRVSFSALQAFLECPHKYKLLYIDKVKFPQSIELAFGDLIHRTLKFFHSQETLPTLDELLSYYKNNWPQKNDYDFQSEEIEQNYFAAGVAILSDYYRVNASIPQKIIDLESRFQVPIKGKDETHILTGAIDRIDQIPGGFEVIDYKTNKIVPPYSSVVKNLQLAIYRLALTNRWPNLKSEDVKLSLYFLRTGEKLTIVKTKDELEETKQLILSIIEEIKTSDFMPTSTKYCRYLPSKLTCPMWKHFYKKEKNLEDQKIDELIKDFFEIKIKIDNQAERLDKIKSAIADYMEKEKIGRVFGPDGYFIKTNRQIFDYDLEKIKPLLLNLNLWNNVLSLDEKKLLAVMEKLPLEIREKINQNKILIKETSSLKSIRAKKEKLLEEAEGEN